MKTHCTNMQERTNIGILNITFRNHNVLLLFKPFFVNAERTIYSKGYYTLIFDRLVLNWKKKRFL